MDSTLHSNQETSPPVLELPCRPGSGAVAAFEWMRIIVVGGALVLAGCDGDAKISTSGGGSGAVIQGSLTEGGGTNNGSGSGGGVVTAGSGVITGRNVVPSVMHSAGEPLEKVQVCVLGQCSTTDGLGQWGMAAPDSFAGGDALFTVNGHGIDSSLVVTLPIGASDIVVTLVHQPGAGVSASRVTADGEDTATGADDAEHDHGSHEHEHESEHAE